jgi:hypothetical protein
LQDGVAVGYDVGVKKADEVGVAEGIRAGIVVGTGDGFGNGSCETIKGMFGLAASGEGETGTTGEV